MQLQKSFSPNIFGPVSGTGLAELGLSELVESVKYGQLYWRFPIQRQEAKCNREVGSQIENLRVVIAITDQRFILLDSTNRSAKMHRNETGRVCGYS